MSTLAPTCRVAQSFKATTVVDNMKIYQEAPGSSLDPAILQERKKCTVKKQCSKKLTHF